MARVYANKLSIYLIKNEYQTVEQILKDAEGVSSEIVGEVGRIYYGDSHIAPPSWIKKFFGDLFNNDNADGKLKIFSASSKAVFICMVENRTFAITFGYGNTLLKPGVWEERFGLKVFLNTVDPEQLRSIDKKNMTVIPKLSKEQMSRDGTVADFGIDVEQDLIQGMTGRSGDDRFGKTITGKDALSVSIKFDVHTIRDFLRICLEKYYSDEYKTNFSFVDNIAEIVSQEKINELNEQLLLKINNVDFEKVWMAIPEVIPWENVDEFRIRGIDSLGDDICLQDYLSLIPESERVEIASYENRIVECIGTSSGDVIYSWRAYDCLCGEINNDGTYILSNGKWYQIENDFALRVDAEFRDFRDNFVCLMDFPNSNAGEHENQYNERVSRELNICNMDRNNVVLGGPHNKVEFCDLFTSDRKIVHVKRYGASSVLSHLFAQGLVSGELFLSYGEFRDKVREKLPDDLKILIPNIKPDTAQYEIIYAIISKSKTSIDIPFFSKVNLRNARRRLEAFGYKVTFKKIQVA